MEGRQNRRYVHSKVEVGEISLITNSVYIALCSLPRQMYNYSDMAMKASKFVYDRSTTENSVTNRKKCSCSLLF